MSHPQVLEARKRMKDEEGNTLKSCDNYGELKTLPRNAMESGFFEFVHNVRKRGKALLGALIELLVSKDPGIQ